MIALKREIDQIAKDKGIDRKVIVGALEEANRRERPGRGAGDVQGHGAAVARLQRAQHCDACVLALDRLDPVAAELAPGLHGANHRISGWLASPRSTNPRLRPPLKTSPRPTWRPAVA